MTFSIGSDPSDLSRRRGSQVSLAMTDEDCAMDDLNWERNRRRSSMKIITADEIAKEVIRTELPPLVKPKMETQLVETVSRHFEGPMPNMSIEGKVLQRYSTLEEAQVYCLDNAACGGGDDERFQEVRVSRGENVP